MKSSKLSKFWKTNKDEVLTLFDDDRLSGAVWRKENVFQAVVYGEYPRVWSKHKIFTTKASEAQFWVQTNQPKPL